MSSSIDLNEVSVSFGRHQVLRGISLPIGEGEWIGIVGPNGAGKSTLLGTLAGAVEFGGSIAVDGRELSNRTRRERSRLVAYVPQVASYPVGMAVFDYVLLGRTPYVGPLGAESREDIDTVWSALDALHIRQLASRDVATLSGGESQRASLARVLAQSAPIVVLDEATAALDVSARHEAMELIDRLRTERGITVVSAMHDLTSAAQFCDRVALIDDGQLVAAGAPTDVLSEGRLREVFDSSIRVLNVDGSIVVVTLRSEERAQ